MQMLPTLRNSAGPILQISPNFANLSSLYIIPGELLHLPPFLIHAVYSVREAPLQR